MSIDEFKIFLPHIGSHIRKGKSIVESVKKYIETHPIAPIQIFIASNQSSKIPKTLTDLVILETRELMKSIPNKLFIHSPYIINMARPIDPDNPWAFDLLSRYLKIGDEMKSSGIVVHCGKHCKEKSPLENMHKFVMEVLKYASPECPLLLETSSGQGTEMLSDPDNFIKFYKSVKETERFKICVDTCHVFAAGYDPMEFIKQLIENDCPIVLIHLNNSQYEKGCKKDRHAPFYDGMIEKDDMLKVIRFAVANDIPMVTE